ALARLGSQQLEAVLLARVALAQQRSLVEPGLDRGPRGILIERHHGLAATADVDLLARGAHHDHFGVARRALQALAGAVWHVRSPVGKGHSKKDTLIVDETAVEDRGGHPLAAQLLECFGKRGIEEREV